MPICGFQVSDFPLWKLGDLLDETWVEEDVMNALAELLYYQRAALITYPVSPTHLYLPTSFLIDARYLYHQAPRVYSPELMAFRQRLNTTAVHVVGFLALSHHHYSAYVLHDGKLLHSDSLGHPALKDDLDILCWIFSGSSYTFPTDVVEVASPRQSATGPGSGSCGIASHDFIASYFELFHMPRWSSFSSAEFRNNALRNLVIFHEVAWQVIAVCLKDYGVWICNNIHTVGC